MNRCGECDNWMKKSSCPREKVGRKPSCMEFACKEFTLVKWEKQQREAENGQ